MGVVCGVWFSAWRVCVDVRIFGRGLESKDKDFEEKKLCWGTC